MGTQSYREQVAAEVRAEIARKNKSLNDVAEVAGIARSTMSRKAKGGGAFDVEELRSIAAALDVPMADLLPGATTRTAA